LRPRFASLLSTASTAVNDATIFAGQVASDGRRRA
jgi:hypothetical protein